MQNWSNYSTFCWGQINQSCGKKKIPVLPWGYMGEINDPPSHWWVMTNNHVGKQRPCFCLLIYIIPHSGIPVSPLTSLLSYGTFATKSGYTLGPPSDLRKHTELLKTPFATPCRWDAPKVCPKWVTWRNMAKQDTEKDAGWWGRALVTLVGLIPGRRRKTCQSKHVTVWILHDDHDGIRPKDHHPIRQR